MDANVQVNYARYPDWLPPEFIVDSGNAQCPTPSSVLRHFGLSFFFRSWDVYSTVAIAVTIELNACLS